VVLDHGVLLPRPLPELVADVDDLTRQVVAVVVGHLAVHAEVAGGAVEVGGDDVPGDPAVG
jgi:hypothetical protein